MNLDLYKTLIRLLVMSSWTPLPKIIHSKTLLHSNSFPISCMNYKHYELWTLHVMWESPPSTKHTNSITTRANLRLAVHLLVSCRNWESAENPWGNPRRHRVNIWNSIQVSIDSGTVERWAGNTTHYAILNRCRQTIRLQTPQH